MNRMENEKLDQILNEIKGLKGDVQGLKGDVQGLKGDVQGLKGGQEKLESGQKKLESGQKQALERIGGLDKRMCNLENGQVKLQDKMQTVYSDLKKEIVLTGTAVKETVREEIRRLDDKLDAHMREPAHA